MRIGDWGLRIGDCGLGIAYCGLPIPYGSLRYCGVYEVRVSSSQRNLLANCANYIHLSTSKASFALPIWPRFNLVTIQKLKESYFVRDLPKRAL